MKKVLSMLLVVMLVLASVSALAEEVPSKTAENLTVVNEVVAENGVVLVEVVEPAEQVTGYMGHVVEVAVDPSFNVMDLFTEETKAAVAEKIGEAAVEMNEIIAADVLTEAAETGAVVVNVTFPTVYAPEQTLVAVAIVFHGEVVEEIVLDAVANEDGTVSITFPAEAIQKMVDADEIALAILNTK